MRAKNFYRVQASLSMKKSFMKPPVSIRYTSDQSPAKDTVIIFTSPSTIRCFFENFEWDESYRAVVIGNAIQKHLPARVEYLVADEPSFAVCIDKARAF
ncbi:MAG: hypothetical protein ABXS91_00100 [Sulfurimonas sp.]